MQDTITLTTENNHAVVFKPFLTGRQVVSLNDGDESEVDAATTILTKNSISKANRMIELLVISVDGSADKVLDAVLDLPSPDYIEILHKTKEIVEGKKKA